MLNRHDIKTEFSRNYDEYITSIFRFVYVKTSSTMIAEDITADVFAKYWQSLQKNSIDNTRAYLYRLARNTIVDYYRKNGKANIVPVDMAPEIVDDNQDVGAQSIKEDDMTQIVKAMSNLSDDQQIAISSYYLDGKTIPEISRQMRKKDSAVRTIISRGLSKIRENIQEV